jgi:hypothetical protein
MDQITLSKKKCLEIRIKRIKFGYGDEFDKIIIHGNQIGFTNKQISKEPVLLYYIIMDYIEKFY